MWLARFNNNYADEFDVDGCLVLTDADKAEWEYAIEMLEKHKLDVGYYGFGSNEGIEFSSIEDFVDSFEWTEITDTEAKFLQTHFSTTYGYGMIPDVSWLQEQVLDQLEEGPEYEAYQKRIEAYNAIEDADEEDSEGEDAQKEA